MKYAIVFGLLAVYLAVMAAVLGGAGWVLLWLAVNSAILAAAYAGLGPGVLGKRANGRLAWWALLLLPYLGITWLVWHAQRLLSREACCDEVAPGLWVGRRPLPHEVPAGIDLVVDLSAELAEPRGVMRGRSYLCLPVLDTLAPAPAAFRELIARVAAWPGPVYVHCAVGHGRSALVAAAVLLARGLARDGTEAEAMLRRARPAVRLKPAQRRLLEEFDLAVSPPRCPECPQGQAP
jgi:protein-tyrosine phosphatase